MDTKKLRQKILDLAIRGKLVPQDPNDEPASVLLERIRAEKERLIKEGKIKRSKKSNSDTPHYENILFELPSNWKMSTLAEVFYMHAGKSISASQISSSKDHDYCYQCIGGNGLRGFVENYNTEGKFPIIGRQGALCGNINFVEGKFYATEHAVIVDTFCNTNVRWAYYILIQLNLKQYATATAQPGLSVNTIGDVHIPIPPLEEQKRIVSSIEHWFKILDEIDKEKGCLQKIISQSKSKILNLAIHGKLVPQDPNDEPAIELLKRINPSFEPCDNPHFPNQFPSSWICVKLNEVSELITGTTPSKLHPEYYGGDFPFYKPSDLDAGRHVIISTEYLSDEGKSASRIIPIGSTAICCIGSIGKCGYIEKEGATNQQINAAVPSNALNSLYLYYFCNSSFFIDEITADSSAITISIVNKSKLGKMFISLPPLQEQHRIVAKIEELFAILDDIKESLEA